MYGVTGKVGRGGGGGRGASAGKRNIHSTFHAPPLHRPSGAPGGRLSVGGGGAGPRSHASASVPTSSVPSASAEETFSLVTGNPLNFAMIIRLAPDLVEEIKRVEAQGGTARIKFDANANNTSGNVINVGDKDFRFTWSREMGDLCDIYEERQSGEDGNGLLVESGCAWRKLNVQRVLDESTKKHVKMRSEEAERKLKSRKAIVLDPGNASMKSQMKALAAAETNPWRMHYKQKKEPPFKKRKTEPSAVGGPPKATYKSGLSTTTSSKGRVSTSPLSSPHQQSGAPASPFGSGNLLKGTEDIVSLQTENKTMKLEKEMSSRPSSGTALGKSGARGNIGDKPSDLQNMLISLLNDNQSKGLSLKALEKAVGDAFPNSGRHMETILKKIAIYQAPGKYILKPGTGMETFTKPSTESGSSPEDVQHLSPVSKKHDPLPALASSFSIGADTNKLEQQAELSSKPGEAPYDSEKIDILNHSPDNFNEKKPSENSEGPAGSSSGSETDMDSESDSSDSGSDSKSHSRSRSSSPGGSGSGSSSDSESDASSNSKEASDEDVDIMTSDDDKEFNNQLQVAETRASKSPFQRKIPEGELSHIRSDEKQDDHVHDFVEIEKDFMDDDNVVEADSGPDKGAKIVGNTKHQSPDFHEHQENHISWGKLYNETDNIEKDLLKSEWCDSASRASKGKSKKGFDEETVDAQTNHAKIDKVGNVNQLQISGTRNPPFASSPRKSSPDRMPGSTGPMPSRVSRDAPAEFGLNRNFDKSVLGKSVPDPPQSDRRSVDGSRTKIPGATDKPGKRAENNIHGVKHSERSLQMNENFSVLKDGGSREVQDGNGLLNDKRPRNFPKDAVGDKQPTALDYSYRKQEVSGKLKEAGSVPKLQQGSSPKDVNMHAMAKSPIMNGRGNMLRRELSDLELGELRESQPEEAAGSKRQFERKSSFKSDNRFSTSEYWNLDSTGGSAPGKIITDSRNSSPPNPNIMVSGISEALPRPEHYGEDFPRPHQKTVQPQPYNPYSRVDHMDAGSQHNKLVEMTSKGRHSEAEKTFGIVAETYGDSHRKVPASAPQPHESKRAVTSSTKERKKKQSNSVAEIVDRRNDASLIVSNDGHYRRRECSSDETSCSYSKYEKEEPELRGPIKDFSQYKEYVQEYREKYDSYCSLNKLLESYRNEFSKFGRDLEASKGRDMERYYDILHQMKESYRQCGERHKRLKKIFLLLHEELGHLKQMIRDYASSYAKE